MILTGLSREFPQIVGMLLAYLFQKLTPKPHLKIMQ